MADVLSGRAWEEQWLRDVLGDEAASQDARRDALLHVDDVCRGRVKFFKAEKGWGGIQSSDTPADVWVIWAVIESDGDWALSAGELVEFRWEPGFQDSWRCVATWVRSLEGCPH